MRIQLGALGLSVALAVGAGAAEEGFRTLARGSQSGIKNSERVVVKTQEEWNALWKRHSGEGQASEAPKVDWSKEMVLGAFLGIRTTGGYAIQIADVREQEGKLVVRLEAKTPRPGGFVTQAITSPYHLVAVSKSTLPVTWTANAPK